MEEEEEVKKTIGTTLTIFAIAAVILTVLMLLFTDRILILLKTPEESFELAGTMCESAAWAFFLSAAIMR